MVIRLDLNVTDPAVNLRDLKDSIPRSCWSYLRQFQFYSTVYLNITTFNIEVGKVTYTYQIVSFSQKVDHLNA